MIQDSANIMQEGIIVTAIGLFVVFFVLLLLALIISLFRFIPGENNIRSSEKNILPIPSVFTSEVKLSPLHQAIIIATILEDVHVSSSKNFVKINKIIQLEAAEGAVEEKSDENV